MKLFHLNCGTMHPFGLPEGDDSGGFAKRGLGVIHCLLIETKAGLVLIDSGWGTEDILHPTPTVRQFMTLVKASRDLNETAFAQVKALGYYPSDVKHILLTHLHLYHAGGLPDFPSATVHVYEPELQAYLYPKTFMEKHAYRQEHSAHHPVWQTHTLQGDLWFGLECTPAIQIGEVEFTLVPLTGHTRGHCAVAVRTGERWLLDCGDAYGYFRQIDSVQPYTHPCGKWMESMIIKGFDMPRVHWYTLRELLREHASEIQTFCAHDAHEFFTMSR